MDKPVQQSILCAWCRQWILNHDDDDVVVADREPMTISHGICKPCFDQFVRKIKVDNNAFADCDETKQQPTKNCEHEAGGKDHIV